MKKKAPLPNARNFAGTGQRSSFFVTIYFISYNIQEIETPHG